MANLDDEITAHEQKLKELKAMKRKEKAAEAKRNRAAEMRRKELIGAMILAEMRRDEAVKESILNKLDGFLSQPDDRALFDLIVREILSEERQRSLNVAQCANGVVVSIS